MLDTEAEAQALYHRAGADAEEPPSPITLARMLGLSVDVQRGLPTSAALVRDLHAIWISSRLSGPAVGYAVAHEIAEWHCEGHQGSDREALCDSLAAALLAPLPAVRLVLDLGPADLLPHARLADAFRTTQSIAALRYAEATGTPLALVTRQRIHVRGAPFEWGADRDVRRAARDPVAPFVAWPVTDARSRCVLVVT